MLGESAPTTSRQMWSWRGRRTCKVSRQGLEDLGVQCTQGPLDVTEFLERGAPSLTFRISSHLDACI